MVDVAISEIAQFVRDLLEAVPSGRILPSDAEIARQIIAHQRMYVPLEWKKRWTRGQPAEVFDDDVITRVIISEQRAKADLIRAYAQDDTAKNLLTFHRQHLPVRLRRNFSQACSPKSLYCPR